MVCIHNIFDDLCRYADVPALGCRHRRSGQGGMVVRFSVLFRVGLMDLHYGSDMGLEKGDERMQTGYEGDGISIHSRFGDYLDVFIDDDRMMMCANSEYDYSLTDDDVRNLADFCLNYLRWKETRTDRHKDGLLAVQRYRRWRYEIQRFHSASDLCDIVL